MSEYFQCLQGHARATYLEKLRLVGLEACDVRTIVVWAVDNIGLLKALVNPSQRSPDNTHRCWLAVKKRWNSGISTLYLHGWVNSSVMAIARLV